MKQLGERAIVIGASIGGLMAARMLADFYGEVLLVERDRFPGSPVSRRGVPQGRHGHVLIRRGSLEMFELFPGLLNELVACGAPVWDGGDLTKIDASFGGHRLVRVPALLESRGYPRPAEDALKIRLTYSSQLFRMSPKQFPEIAISVGFKPGRTKGAWLFSYENDALMLTLGGIMGHEPPSEVNQMLDEVAELVPAHVVEALRLAEPVGEPARFHFPASRWRRYDKLRRFPKGLVVTDDAFCSFNPIYGQGMTVATLDALALTHWLRVKVTWRAAFSPERPKRRMPHGNMSVGSALALPEVSGKSTLAMRLFSLYTNLVLRRAESNPFVAEQFWKVVHLVVPPTQLLKPAVLLQVLTSLICPRWPHLRDVRSGAATSPSAKVHADPHNAPFDPATHALQADLFEAPSESTLRASEPPQGLTPPTNAEAPPQRG